MLTVVNFKQLAEAILTDPEHARRGLAENTDVGVVYQALCGTPVLAGMSEPTAIDQPKQREMLSN